MLLAQPQNIAILRDDLLQVIPIMLLPECAFSQGGAEKQLNERQYSIISTFMGLCRNNVGGCHYLVQSCAWGKQGAMNMQPLPMAMNGV